MNKITILLFLFLGYFTGTAQDTLFLKNGEIETGKISSINKTVVRLYSDETGKVKRFTDRNIEKASILVDGKGVEYTFEEVPFLGKVLLGKLYSGRVNLYTTSTYVPGGMNNATNNYEMGGEFVMYYLKKENDDTFYDPNYDGVLFNKFHNRLSKYFKDCPELSGRIKTKLLTMDDLKEICEIYDQCPET